MLHFDHIFFWPVIVLIGIIVIVLSARFLFRLAIFIIAILLIWYAIAYIGLVPAPAQFFQPEVQKSEKLGLLKYEKRWRLISIQNLLK